MSKLIVFFRSSTPENPQYGYGDHVIVYRNDNADDKECLFAGHSSTCCNAHKTMPDGTIVSWEKAYALVKEGEFTFTCILSPKHSKCLLLNGRLETVNPNVNHDNQYYAESIEVHSGGLKSVNKLNRGSKGCFTIPPEDWQEFIKLFEVGETGRIILKKLIENK